MTIFSFLYSEVVRLGEWDLTTTEDCETTVGGGTFCAPPVQDFQPEEIIPHPSYNTRVRFSDDIALIRLDRPINFQESAGKLTKNIYYFNVTWIFFNHYYS